MEARLVKEAAQDCVQERAKKHASRRGDIIATESSWTIHNHASLNDLYEITRQTAAASTATVVTASIPNNTMDGRMELALYDTGRLLVDHATAVIYV